MTATLPHGGFDIDSGAGLSSRAIAAAALLDGDLSALLAESPDEVRRSLDWIRCRLYELDGERDALPAPDRSQGSRNELLGDSGRGSARHTRCLIWDPSEFFSAGLAAALRTSAGAVVARVALLADVPEQVRCFCPDVVIASLDPPGEARALARAVTGVPMMVMSWSHCEDPVLEALRAGARAHVHKEAGIAEVVATIDRLRTGEPASPAGPPRGAPGSLPDAEALTAREREIVALIGLGLSNKQVARDLGIAPQTVKNHLHHAMRKLNISSRLGLFAWSRTSRAGTTTSGALVPVGSAASGQVPAARPVSPYTDLAAGLQ